MSWPTANIPQDHHITLAQIVARTSFLPHRDTVALFPVAVFPTVRKKKDVQIGTRLLANDGATLGMYDNNTTPKLALGWTHGFTGATTGWTIAHVWPTSEDVTAYTHLANLMLVPEALASTTDKEGPLTAFLRWHSYHVYGWQPTGTHPIEAPAGYDTIVWRYMNHIPNARALLRQKLTETRNQSLVSLRGIMAELHHPTLYDAQ